MKALEISNLDQHLKPVQIDGVSTPLELSTTDLRISSGELSINNLTAGTAKVDGDLTVDGNIDMTGSVSEINMAFSTQINAITSQGIVAVEASGMIIDNVNYGGDDPTFLSIYPSEVNVGDAQIRLYNYTSIAWNIGNDADDSQNLKFDYGNTTTGGATKLTLSNGGNLTASGDVISGDDVAVPATAQINFDGIGGDTYIHEVSADKMELVAGGDEMITLDEANQRITLEADKLVYKLGSGGDEWSIADSAWAGTIIGYRMIGEDAASDSYALTTSFVVPDSNMTVRFESPPSGAVEVMVQIYADTLTTRRRIYFGLSDNATYNTIGVGYEQFHHSTSSADDDETIQHYWTITGLTAGDTYNYWFGAKTSATIHTLRWGGTSTNQYPDFIMKVTALPTAVANYAEYD